MPKLDGFGVAREMVRRRIASAIIFLTLHARRGPVHRSDGPRRSRLHPRRRARSRRSWRASRRWRRASHYVTPSLTALLLGRRAAPDCPVPAPARPRRADARPSADPAARRRRALEQGDRRAAVRALPDRREPPRQHRPEARPPGPQRRPEVRAPAQERALAGGPIRAVTHARACVRPHADRAEPSLPGRRIHPYCHWTGRSQDVGPIWGARGRLFVGTEMSVTFRAAR